MLFAVLMLVLALAQPRWGLAWEEIRRDGVDLIIALDVSDSMLVQDVQNKGHLSRLEQAKREIVDLLRIVDGDRVGLVAFAGAAFVQCPLTLDYNAAAVFLDDLNTDLIAVKGTALAEGIRTALTAMAGAEHGSQAIILITDGEDHGGEVAAAAQQAAEQHVRIFPIGIGRDEGAPIPKPDGGFVRDAQGNLVLSRLDEPTLQAIANTTGGIYSRSVAGEMDLERLYRRGIRAMLKSKRGAARRRQHFEERFVYFVGLAALALMLEALLPSDPRRRTTPP
ncbi:MAG: VWA domain-containing protein [Deltaproteobacteria bacterium]|nr:MAG: VWA domain-containing protein [Deltaproteobacteria bacterium]